MLHLVFASLATMAFAGAGMFNMVGTAATRKDFERWGYPGWWCRVTGLLELLVAVLIAGPQTRSVGLAFGAAIILAAAATVVRNRDFSHLKPISAFVALLAAAATVSLC